MSITLLIIIFISFIGVGLPDSVLGTAWPAIYREFNLPISLAGYITSTVSAGTIISSLMSSRLINRFGTGLVTAASTFLTAIALLGFALTRNPVFFFIFSIPLGLGAGAVDTALNSYVALHYSASALNFMQCFYGIGVTASPFIMALALGNESNWRKGYFFIAIIQIVITIITFMSLPLWKKAQGKSITSHEKQSRNASIAEMLKNPSIRLSCLAFFSICALELTVGSWSATYFVNIMEADKDKAAMLAMLFYSGLAIGRFLSGIFVDKIGRRRVLRICCSILPVAIFAFMLPMVPWICAVALFFIGLAVGPVFPNLVHLTPKFSDVDIVQSVMGIQQSMTYVGIMLMPWLFGMLAQAFTVALLPYYLMILFLIYALVSTMLMKRIS